MSDIFLSYKSEDRPRAKIIAEALERCRYKVWWDRIIPPGKTFDGVITEALDSAKCVIVLWSKKSVLSDWVKEEADKGKKKRILIPILIDDVEMPIGFGRIQAARLIDWDGTSDHEEFDLLLGSIAGILGQSPAAKIEDKKPPIKEEQADDQITKLLSQLAQAETRKDWDQVIVQGEQILELNADHEPTRSKTASAYDLRGESYIKKGDLSKAIADLNRAIELDPDKQVYYHSRGVSYHMKAEYDKAIADFNSAIELDPNQAYYYSRGISYHEKGDYDKAIADKTQAIELDPNQAEYYEQRGLSYYKKGDLSKTIADLNRAIELDPNLGECYYVRGMTYKRNGDGKSARRDFQYAAELGHENAEKELEHFPAK